MSLQLRDEIRADLGIALDEVEEFGQVGSRETDFRSGRSRLAGSGLTDHTRHACANAPCGCGSKTGRRGRRGDWWLEDMRGGFGQEQSLHAEIGAYNRGREGGFE
jgi:hypothetical protein